MTGLHGNANVKAAKVMTDCVSCDRGELVSTYKTTITVGQYSNLAKSRRDYRCILKQAI